MAFRTVSKLLRHCGLRASRASERSLGILSVARTKTICCRPTTNHQTPTTHFRASSLGVLGVNHGRRMSALSNVALGDDAHMLETVWASGEKASYPMVWLRDNCYCEYCYHPGSRTRTLAMQDLDINVKADRVDIDDLAHEVIISWRDGHKSRYDFDWLKDRRFTETAAYERAEWFPLPPRLWGASEMQDKIPTDTYDNLMHDDAALFQWLQRVEEDGIFLIKEAPSKSNMITELASRMGHFKTVHTGHDHSARIRVNEPTHMTYSASEIPFYTDLPHLKHCPGMQMIHCIQPGGDVGGVNIYADGFNIAQLLREKYPEHFKTLSTVPMEFYDVAVDYYKFHKISSMPIICLNVKGELERIVYNNQMRDSFLTTSLDNVIPLYEAMSIFDHLMYDENNRIAIKLSQGDIMCFYNYRVLHGRTAMQEGHGMERHLEGGYVDWEDMLQQRRMLQAKFGVERMYEQ